MSEVPKGWRLTPLQGLIKSKSGDSKIIKGKQSSAPAEGLFQGFSASGPDLWVPDAHYDGDGIVVSAVGARCGKTFLARGKWTAIANTHVLMPSPAIDPRFLWYLTNDESWWIKSGTAQPFVKVKDTLERPQLIPPLEEQRHIVEILDDHFSRLDAAKDGLVSVSRRLPVLRDALSHKAFSALSQSRVPLGNVIRLKSGYAYKSTDWQTRGVPVVKIANVRNGIVDLSNCSFVSEEVAAETSEFKVLTGDLLLTLTGEIGATGFYSGSRPARLNQRVARVDVLDATCIDLQFVAAFLASPAVRSIMWTQSKGMAQPNISPKDILQIEVPIPSLSEQREFLTNLEIHLSEVERVASQVREVAAGPSQLRRSMLHAAFTGQLTREFRND